MYCITEIDYLRNFDMTFDDIDCFSEKTSEKIIKEEKIEESITKEEIKILDLFIFDEIIAGHYTKDFKKEKTKNYVTGLKIRYSVVPKKQKNNVY